MNTELFRVRGGEKMHLSKVPTTPGDGFDKEKIKEEILPENLKELADWQEKLFAHNEYGLIIVLQAMDAAGKDSMIKKVFTYIDPQGVRVTSFKQPSKEELDRDYLWRINKGLPRRGEIGVFNRSHYEDVIVTRVHDLLKKSPLPIELIDKDIWDRRFRQINDWERYLYENGFPMLKFFLHVSKEEQAERLKDRIVRPEKHWKFSFSDINERRYWDEYRKAYQHMLIKTSTDYAPWYVVPADKKWFSRYLVTEVILNTLRKINPTYPPLSPEDQERLAIWREMLSLDGNMSLKDLSDNH